MALGTNHQTITTADKFIPEIWSDEVVATYKKNLVLANLIKKISFKGKKATHYIFQNQVVALLTQNLLLLK